MFLQRLSQRAAVSSRLAFGANRIIAMAPSRTYYLNDVLMPREQGEYYSDPMDVAERVVRVIALHDNVNDPAKVVLGAPFTALGLNLLDLCEIYIGCEREFDLEISEEDCETFTTVNCLVEFIARHPSSK